MAALGTLDSGLPDLPPSPTPTLPWTDPAVLRKAFHPPHTHLELGRAPPQPWPFLTGHSGHEGAAGAGQGWVVITGWTIEAGLLCPVAPCGQASAFTGTAASAPTGLRTRGCLLCKISGQDSGYGVY